MGTNKKQQKTQQSGHQTGSSELKFYLKEFGGRLLLLVGSFVVAAIVGFEFKDIIQTLVTLQLADLNMVNFAQAEGVLPTVQISLLAGVIGGLPFGAYHTYRFFAPILARGAWYGFRMIGSSFALLIAAIAYAFTVTIPLGLGGMVAATENPVATQTFLTFAVGNVIAAVLLSQLPLLVIFLNGIKRFTTRKFFIFQGVGVAGIVLSAALATSFATPSKGALGMLLLIAPVIVAFEASMFWAKFHGRTIVKEAPREVVEAFEEEHLKESAYEAEERSQQPVSAPASRPRTTPVVAVAPAQTPQVASAHTPSVAAPAIENTQPTLEDIFDAMLADDSDESEEEYYQQEAEVAPVTTHESAYQAPQLQFAAASQSQQPHAPVVSYTGMPTYRPQPLPQPRPVTHRQPAYSRPIRDMLRPSQATTPQLRSLNTPRQTIPFQTTIAH